MIRTGKVLARGPEVENTSTAAPPTGGAAPPSWAREFVSSPLAFTHTILAMARIVGASALLGPVALGAQIAGAMTRSRIEAARARDALARLGIDDQPLAIEPIGGGRSNAVYRVAFANRTLVLKVALTEGTVLAFAARLVGPQPYARDVTAAGRIGREARALGLLHAAGVRVPRVIAAAPDAGLLLVEYVDGVPLPATLHLPGAAERIQAYARVLRAAHRAGVTIADAHPGNALVTADGEIVLIDLEFAEPHFVIVEADARQLPATASYAARVAFDVAYAAQYFAGHERQVFLAASSDSPAVRRELARLAPFAPMFALERRRQRRATLVAVQRAA